MIRTYYIVCPSCQGRGYIPNPENGLITVATITCPACDGNKKVLVTEQSNDKP